MAFNFNNNDTITLSFTVTMTLNNGQSTMNERECKAICDQVQSTTMKAFSNNGVNQNLVGTKPITSVPKYGEMFGSKPAVTSPVTSVPTFGFGSKSAVAAPELKSLFGSKPAVTAPVTSVPTFGFGSKSAVAAPEVKPTKPIVEPVVFANPTFHSGTTFQNVGAQAQRHTVIRGSELLQRVVNAIGHRKQTFTPIKHRYIASRMKKVFHSRREMQVSEHRIKTYLMRCISPMEKKVMETTSEYRHIYYKTPEQLILAHKRRTIINRVNSQYNKLMKTMFPVV